MCGSESRLFKTKLEGSILNVCKNCSKYGKVIGNVADKAYLAKIQKKKEKEQTVTQRKEVIEAIVEEFPSLIKEKREKLNLSQEDFAKKINEKLSIIHKLETGHFKPSIRLARKIEHFLKIELIEQFSGASPSLEHKKSEGFTLGDFIKKK